jgi:hypothetical protein
VRKLSGLYADQLKQVYAAIREAEEGGSVSLTLRGTTYTALAALYVLADLVRVESAIAAIEEGAQAYTIADHTWNRADLSTLYARKREIEAKLARAMRGGIRMRLGVPI